MVFGVAVLVCKSNLWFSLKKLEIYLFGTNTHIQEISNPGKSWVIDSPALLPSFYSWWMSECQQTLPFIAGHVHSWERLAQSMVTASWRVLFHILSVSFFSPFLLLLCCCCLVAESSLTLCDSMDCSPPGSSVHAVSQARLLEWVAGSPSRGSPSSGVELVSPACPALAGRFFTTEPPGKPSMICTYVYL